MKYGSCFLTLPRRPIRSSVPSTPFGASRRGVQHLTQIENSCILFLRKGRTLTRIKKIKKANMQEMDIQFLEYVVKALVNNPEEVKITRTVDEMGVLLTLDVSREDMGKVIGRDGNTAKAIRTLLRVVGMKNNARVNLKINEPGGARPQASESLVEDVLEDLKQL